MSPQEDISIDRIRNTGFVAHIDAGKTTVTERILYYTGKKHTIGEVHDGKAEMDWMRQERERGITIASASTSCLWEPYGETDYKINIIDTPGHIDFTAEVECALSVLDIAVLILDASAGVQAQTYTVNRQMNKYQIPRIAFVNKCDKDGASVRDTLAEIKDNLGLKAALINIPNNMDANGLETIVDLVDMRILSFEGKHGEIMVAKDVPEYRLGATEVFREDLIETLCLVTGSEALLEEYSSGTLTAKMLHTVIRDATIYNEFVPVLTGSALKNIGIQPLLDAIAAYGPSPFDVQKTAHCPESNGELELQPIPYLETVAFCYKLQYVEDWPLAHFRVFQGQVMEGDKLLSPANQDTISISRGRMSSIHADKRKQVDRTGPGDFFVLPIGLRIGTTLTSGKDYSVYDLSFPEPVISQAIMPDDKKSEERLPDVLAKYALQNPTFIVSRDEETGETIIEGMGELHLNIVVDQLVTEHGLNIRTADPQVAYREQPRVPVDFNYKHKKQTGGHGQYAHVIGRLESFDGRYHFENSITGGAIPEQYIKACDKGFQSGLDKGILIGAPVTGVKIVLEDGSSHEIDSSDLAFSNATSIAFKQAYLESKPEIIEPIMSVCVECRESDIGSVIASINQRDGRVEADSILSKQPVVKALVPLRNLFGYATDLRSITGGFASFTIEPHGYEPVPQDISKTLIAEYQNSIKK